MSRVDKSLVQKLSDEDNIYNTADESPCSIKPIINSLAFEGKGLYNKVSIADLSTKASDTPTQIQKESPTPILTATVTFVATSMGTGWLTLPKAFATYGLVNGLILMSCAGINGFIALWLFAKASRRYKESKNYAQLVSESLGNKMKNFLNIVFFIN